VPDSEGGSSKGIGDARVKIVPRKKELDPSRIIHLFMMVSLSLSLWSYINNSSFSSHLLMGPVI